jgi:amylosucrase
MGRHGLYCDRFAGDLQGLRDRLPYLQELGVNMLHIMPILDCPPDNNDGGYAVRDFRKIDLRYGTIEDVEALADVLKAREMLLVLDVVVNHTSDEHEWAQRAQNGEQKYQDYYYVFDNREEPDAYEQTMPETFPVTAPGNFTWNEAMGKWVMTVFNNYQWDLNYRNPAVLIEMLDIILFWANKGADILRLDAVAFLWKKIGTTCQNERKAHLLLRLMKDCCQVTAPGSCSLPKPLWPLPRSPNISAKMQSTPKNAKSRITLRSWPCSGALWQPRTRLCLIWGSRICRPSWSGRPGSIMCAATMISGSGSTMKMSSRRDMIPCSIALLWWIISQANFPDRLAEACLLRQISRLETRESPGPWLHWSDWRIALETQNEEAIDDAIKTIHLLHNVILSFGGIPLLYYGDAIGTLNNFEYLDNPATQNDSRWVHRSYFDWNKAERRNESGTVEQRIFVGLKKLIALRKEVAAFADFDNREVVSVDNPNLLVFYRTDPENIRSKVLVISNFNVEAQQIPVDSTDAAWLLSHMKT